MNCREVEKVADLFVDGELEARAMRAVAMHVTRCSICEALVQRLERLEEVIGDTFADAVADVDFSRFWPAIAARAGEVQRPWWTTMPPLRGVTATRAVAAAMVAAIALGALTMYRQAVSSVPARANNQVRIDSLVADADSVAVLSEPQSNTTVIWVVSKEGATAATAATVPTVH